jgi:predicted nucleotidyltransferase
MVDQHVVTAVRNYLRALKQHGIAVRFAVVFGSWAKGKADEWSDIDVLLVSARFDNVQGRPDIDLLWRVAAQNDSRIEPLPCGERQWHEDDSSPLVEIARREGECIMPAEDV